MTQPVELRSRGFKEVLRTAVSGTEHVADIVHRECIRHDKMGLAVDESPVRQVVVVTLRVVLESPFFDYKLTRIDAHLTRIPADRAMSERCSQRLHGEPDRLTFLVARHLKLI